ncbi:MAG: twin-arginine translocase subunit TatC [Pyrinomonadaceae bacterium]
MPAITYVLARIGLVDAHFLVSHWKISLVVILVAAAVLSPTNDIPNMMLLRPNTFENVLLTKFVLVKSCFEK